MKRCPRWKKEQKVLWEEVQKETGKGTERWKVHELFEEVECSQAVLDFLSSTEVGKIVPGESRDEDAESKASQWELRERTEREEEGMVEELGAEEQGEEEHGLFLPTLPFMYLAEPE